MAVPAGADPHEVAPEAAEPEVQNSGRLTREHLQALEEARLSPYALRSARARRRLPLQTEGRAFDFRTEFQRDRDRIVHARAFRRLRQKTQVYVPDRDDHFRNRMIQTLEVAGIARTLARALSLNEDLAEACALGHDLGHCAFGHAGEAVLHGILTGRLPVAGLDPQVAAGCGGFKHNYQSLRVVDQLEKRYRHEGLNLTDPVREGILKHTALRSDLKYPDVVEEGLHLEWPPFLEAQIVALADEVAQQVHDLDDGIHDGAVELEEVERLAIVREVAGKMGEAYAVPSRFLRINQINRGIVHLLVTSVATFSSAQVEAWMEEEGITNHVEYLARREKVPSSLINFAPQVREMYGQLKKFVHRRIINSFVVNRSDERARRFLLELFTAYYGSPRLLDDHVLLRFKEQAGIRFLRDCSPAQVAKEVEAHYRNNPVFVRLLADHLASMTDTYALTEHDRLYSAFPRERR